MKSIRIIGMVFLWGQFALSGLIAQQSVRGGILDATTRKPVEGANISINRKPVTATDKNGHFVVEHASFPLILRITHVSYFAKEVVLKMPAADTLEIEMVPATRTIEEVVVTGKPWFQFFRPNSFYVQDFAIQNDRIWAVGFEGKNILKPELRLLNRSGKTLGRIRLQKPSELFQDPSGTVHLYDNDSIWQLYANTREIGMAYPNRLDAAGEVLFNFQVIQGDTVIYRTFSKYRNLCQFILANVVTGYRDTVFTSFDRSQFKGGASAGNYNPGPIAGITITESPLGELGQGLPGWLKKNDPAYLGKDDKEIMVSESYKLDEHKVDIGLKLTLESVDAFANYGYNRTIVHKPVRSFLFARGGNYFVFEATNLMIWRFDQSFENPALFRVGLNERAKDLNMVRDPSDESLYLSYQVDGKCFVSLIDPATCLITKTTRIRGFPFAEKIKVYGGRIYFIQQALTGQNFTNLYSMAFEGGWE